jgi:hypothetical protein
MFNEVLLTKGSEYMGGSNFYKSTLRLDKKTFDELNRIAQSRDESLADVIRKIIRKGLAMEFIDESEDIICTIVRKQIDIAIKPHIERLAKLASKSGHMSATAAFLNVQALIDLVPKENRKNVKTMYDNARKKAVEYMRTRTEEWENNVQK